MSSRSTVASGSIMRRPTAIHLPLILTAFLGASAANAAPAHARGSAVHRPPAAAGQRTDIEARHDMALAFAELPANSRYGSLGRLDGAEIALLDGQADYGPLLRLDRPALPASPISELDQARIDVLRRDAAQTRGAVSSARDRIGAERGTTP